MIRDLPIFPILFLLLSFLVNSLAYAYAVEIPMEEMVQEEMSHSAHCDEAEAENEFDFHCLAHCAGFHMNSEQSFELIQPESASQAYSEPKIAHPFPIPSIHWKPPSHYS